MCVCCCAPGTVLAVSTVADPCCFAEVEAEFRLLAGRVDGLGFDLPVASDAYVDGPALQTPYSTDDDIIRGSVFDFDVWLQDFRPVWSVLGDGCAGPWRVSGPRCPGGDGWDALRELPRASRALDGVRDRLVAVHVDALPAAERAVCRFMVDAVGLFAEWLSRGRSTAVPCSWRRRFCFMALTSLRFPDLFEHRAEVRHGFDRTTRIALTVLSASGDPVFAASETFEDPASVGTGADSDEFGQVVQTLRADPLLTAPDRVLAVFEPAPAVSWVNDLLWWCGSVDHGDWMVAAVPAVCAVQATADRDSLTDLGVGGPAVLSNPFLLDLALAVADAVPSDGSAEPLRFAEGVLASGLPAGEVPAVSALA